MKMQKKHIAKPLSASEIRKGLKISKKDSNAAMRALESVEKSKTRKTTRHGTSTVVEIHGLDEERMEQVEKTLVSMELSDITKKESLNRKIRVSADTGRAELINTHRKVLGANGIRVFLREPGELAVTMEGSLPWVAFIAGALGAADILKNGGEFKLAKRLEKGYKKSA